MITDLQHDLRVAGRTIPALRGFIPFGAPRTAWLGLGSNVGDRARYLRRAIEELSSIPRVQITKISNVYKADPVGTQGRSFLNLVVEIKITRSPLSLLKATQEVEYRLGRVRTGHWTARTIDIDILAIEGIALQSATLQLPHPFASSRLFVLVPWLELANPRLSCGHSVRSHMESTQFHDNAQAQGLAKIGPLETIIDTAHSP
ncbi:2-amino-4-hydroxy-6-hydroxymethyldihydropteridine diphosphokinase [Stomatohabitans albus]|uniref:2-amino-4-hydroxy-6- hydroxymethyldihydropteridine diphosphokinase n=1 Tax=Stomatohabitans albus TaxID=3110766 RepID=UPI00300D6FA2